MFRSTRWFLKELERRDRAHEAQISQLLDRIMHLADRTWEPPPAYLPDRAEDPDPFEDVLYPDAIAPPDL